MGKRATTRRVKRTCCGKPAVAKARLMGNTCDKVNMFLTPHGGKTGCRLRLDE
jgi:hypothetical protein